jgi:hypothetical protein
MWTRRDMPARETCELSTEPGGYSLVGVVDTKAAGTSVQVEYLVVCTSNWQTRFVRVVLDGPDAVTLELTADEEHRWRRGAEDLPQFDGCIDIDLGFSPSTNTLPIRRLNLAVGDSADVTALWVRFPDLTLHTLPQRYTRTGEHTYRYESRGGEFTADLEVDAAGLVRDYGDYWARARMSRVALSGGKVSEEETD